LNERPSSQSGRERQTLFIGIGLLAALGLSLVPFTLAIGIAHLSNKDYLAVLGPGMALALLAFKLWRLQWEDQDRSEQLDSMPVGAGVLATAALLSAVLGWPQMTRVGETAGFIAALAVAAVAGWYLAPLLRRLPAVPPGDLLTILRPPVTYLLGLADRLGRIWLAEVMQRVTTRLTHSAAAQIWSQRLQVTETVLLRWTVGVFLLIAIGVAVVIATLAA
jgi:hypothetical protein